MPKFDTSRWNQKLEGVELRQAKMMQEGFESIDRKITQANKVLWFCEGPIAVGKMTLGAAGHPERNHKQVEGCRVRQ